MSSEAHYSVEIAKSGKSSCKRCKTKIEKGALRIITTQHNGNYEQKGYHHPGCFNLPKKYAQGAGKITAADFVRTILEDASESGRDILPEKLEELATAIATTTPKKKKDATGAADDADESTPKGWIAKIKAAYNAAQEAEEEKEGKEPAAKKVKTDDGPGVVTPAHIQAYSKIHKLKNDELTDILRWNKQILKGSKDLLLTKVMDGMMYNGRLTRCQLCGGDHPGKLKITEANVQQVICGGGFDDDLKRPIPCNFTSTPDKAPRWQPWYMEAPTEEEDAAMDKLIEDMKGGGDGTGAKAGGSDDPNVPVLVAAVQAEIGDDEDGWKLKGKGVKKATVTLTKVLLAHGATTTDDSKKAAGGEVVVEGLKTIDLPRDDEDNDYKKAKMKVAEVVTMNKDKAIDEMIPLLIESFGYVEDKAAKAAKKESNLASMVTVPANAPVIAALNELAEFYFKEGNRNAGGTYKKAISVLSELDYEITKENAKGLGAGKNKVAGIGKGTAEKLYEFCTTGTIGKLEEKRRESA